VLLENLNIIFMFASYGQGSGCDVNDRARNSPKDTVPMDRRTFSLNGCVLPPLPGPAHIV